MMEENIKSLIERLKQGICRAIGDMRVCPKCGHEFIPEDTTQGELIKLYIALFAKHMGMAQIDDFIGRDFVDSIGDKEGKVTVKNPPSFYNSKEWQQWAIDERDELERRITALKRFRVSPEFHDVLSKDPQEAGRLTVQLNIMEAYTAILRMRIQAFI